MSLTKTAQSLSKAVEPLSRIINSVGIGILAVMMLLTTMDVTLRYVFNRPITGAYELTALMLAVLVAFGLAYTQVHKEHIRIDFIVSRFSPRARAFVDSITTLVGIGILSLITWQSILYAESLRADEVTTAAFFIPLYPIVWVVGVGSAIFCLVFIVDLFNHLAQVVAKGRGWARAGLLLAIVLVSLLFAIPILGERILPQVSPFAAGLFGMCLLIVLLFSGMHIGIAMGLVGFLGFAYVAGLVPALGIIRTTPYITIASYGFSVVPLFILMGLFCSYSGLSRDFYFTMYRWLGYLPGGLAMATVGGCAGFAAVSGSSLATVATMGKVALPEMRRYKYDSALATGCIAAGGSIGILIPPSIALIIYGIIAQQSKVGIRIMEEQIPIREEIAAACEILGYDPLYVANEGKVVACVAPEDAERVIQIMRKTHYGNESTIIGEVLPDPKGRVVMKTRVGGTRIVDMLVGEMLPRIC